MSGQQRRVSNRHSFAPIILDKRRRKIGEVRPGDPTSIRSSKRRVLTEGVLQLSAWQCIRVALRSRDWGYRNELPSRIEINAVTNKRTLSMFNTHTCL